ncbi:MAG: TonB-dependent receptor [Bacteroidales bacterium]|nr:TonB-dependent receptor [Bacteroidales bacterium]
MKIKAIEIKIFIAIVLFWQFNINAFSQTNTRVKLSGKVISAKTMEPLPFANVVAKSTGKGTVTRESGYFDFLAPSIDDTLIITYVGYEPFIKKISDLQYNTTLLIVLEEKTRQIEEVTIITEKERIVRISDNEISTVKISPLLIAKLPNFGEVDIMRSFQLLPGISATNETSAGLYVRGGTPDQNLILFDGMTIYHVDHFYGFFSAFNANTIDDIELIKGGFPAEFGGRTSSVMKITGKPAGFEKTSGGGSVSLLSVNGFIEVPVIKNKLSWQFAARRSYTDLIRTGLYNKIFNMYEEENESQSNFSGGRGMGMMQMEQQPKFHFYDLNSKVTYKLNNKNIFALSLYNGKDKLDNSRDISMARFQENTDEDSGEREITDVASWGNTGVSGQWMKTWSKKFNSNVFLSYSNYFSRRDRKTDNVTPGSTGSVRAGINTYEDNNVQDFSFRFKNEWKIDSIHIIKFGFENSFNNIQYSLTHNDTLSLINNKNEGNQSSLYIQDNICLFKKLNLNIGIRGIYYNIIDKIYFEPRLSVIYEPIENFKLKSAWGKYNQFLTRIIREDVLEGSKDFWLLADNENIPVNSAVHYIVGTSYEKNNFLFDIEAFYKEMKGLTEYSMRFTVSSRMMGEREEYFFEGTGYSKGIEFLLQKKYGKNTGWIGYTLSEVKHTFPDLNYGKAFYALHDQTHEFKTVYSRRIKKWDLATAFIYATGKPYTAPESEYQLTLLDGSTYNYIHVSDKNSLRLPDYHRLDVSATYSWKGVYTDNSVSLSIFNVYNRKNVWYKEYEIEEDEILVTDFILLGTTPNISLTVKF